MKITANILLNFVIKIELDPFKKIINKPIKNSVRPLYKNHSFEKKSTVVEREIIFKNIKKAPKKGLFLLNINNIYSLINVLSILPSL